MHRLVRSLVIVFAIVAGGCAQLETISIGQDRPGDLKPLVNQHEYARARQLTGKYPALDTMETRAWITREESAYEADIFTQARKLEKNNDLLGSVQLLSAALQKIPNSTLLRELRNSIEQQRVEQLKTNEREQLVSRASYMLEQQRLYQNKINLESPSITQRWENKRNEKEARELSTKLLEHGRHAMNTDRLDIAETCLTLSSKLGNTAGADALLAEIDTIRNSRKQVEKKQASIKKKKKQQKVKQKQKNKTRVLVEEVQQALARDDLQVARQTFVQIPASARKLEDVAAIQEELDQAIKVRVDGLIVTGDTEYRADNVLGALRTWTEGLALDPENPELRERVERANRVLARLEELKRHQVK